MLSQVKKTNTLINSLIAHTRAHCTRKLPNSFSHRTPSLIQPLSLTHRNFYLKHKLSLSLPLTLSLYTKISRSLCHSQSGTHSQTLSKPFHTRTPFQTHSFTLTPTATHTHTLCLPQVPPLTASSTQSHRNHILSQTHCHSRPHQLPLTHSTRKSLTLTHIHSQPIPPLSLSISLFKQLILMGI